LIDLDIAPEQRSGGQGRRFVLVAVAAAVVAALLALMYYGLTTQRLETGVAPRPNAVAPDFQLSTFDGQSIHLADLRGKTVVVNFWASWCIPCKDEQPALQAVWQQYQNRGVVFVGINVQDNQHDAETFLRQYNVTYPIVTDPNGAVYVNYGVVGVPETYIVTARGTIGKKIVVPIDAKTLAAFLEELVG